MVRRVASIGVLLALITGVTATGATAEPETTVLQTGTIVSGMTSFYAMAVGDGHIFLTPGPSGSTIAIMNPDGSQAGSIQNVPGASGVVIVHHVLYVAAFQGNRIRRYDLTTDPPTKLPGLPTAPLGQPRDLRYAGGNLWFTSGCDQWGARVGWMPLDGSSVNELTGTNGDWNYCTALEGNGYAPNRIFLHSEGVHPQDLYEYGVGTAKPHLITSDPWDWGSYGGQAAEPLPGGNTFAMYWSGNGGSSFGSPGTFSMNDMTGPSFTYNDQRGSSIAVTANNGGLMAASWSGPYVWGEVVLYRLGQATPLVQYDFRDANPTMWGRGLAFSKDGTSLYAVTGQYTNTVDFRVLDPSLQPSAVSLSTPSTTVPYGTPVDIKAHLDGGVTNRDVVLLALPPQANDWQVIDTKTVDANGDTTFQVLPTGRTAYEADYTGDASTVDSGSDFLVVSVRTAVTGALQGAFKTKNNVAYYHDADTVSYTLHVEPPQPFGWLHVPVQQRTFGAWHDLDGLDVQQNASGDATAVFGPADLGVGRYRVHGTTYQTNDLLPGHSRWARFVIEPDPA